MKVQNELIIELFGESSLIFNLHNFVKFLSYLIKNGEIS